LLLLVTLILGGAAVFYGLSRPSGLDAEKDKKTAAALEQAKAALIGYATGVSNFSANGRPGDLPCPDLNDSGSAWSPNCDSQPLRLGRLPWKELGLPDLRDGDGERLWYAVSSNFKSRTRTPCLTPGATGCLNSDTRGSITIRDPSGTVIHDGSNPDPYTPSGVIAVIFAPGAVLKRQGAGAVQDRTCTGGPCLPSGVCNINPPTLIEKCKSVNYLDVVTTVEDNADFSDGSNTNGFINGIVRDAAKNVIVNDRLLTITYNDLMPLLERRVAAETLNCLKIYADPPGVGRYPWATSDITTYSDSANTLFGRMPDSLSQTTASAPAMPSLWPLSCSREQGSWWTNWKEHMFYGVADAYKPGVGSPSCPTCLSVNPPSAAADKQVVVIVSGKRLAGQLRATSVQKQDLTNYLEPGNLVHPAFTKQPSNATFNDTVLYK